MVSVVAYIAAFCAALVVVWALPLDHPLLQLGVGTVVATVVVFAVSVASNNSSIYDPYWSVQPIALAGVYLWWSGSAIAPRGIVVTVLVFIYAIRLTGNFYRGWAGLPQEDFRYRHFRARFGKGYWPVSLFGIHLFPTAMVWLGCLPLYALTRPGAAALGWLDAVAGIVYLGAVGLAFIADEQLRIFRDDPANRGLNMQRGLWGVSRHPNYLGEIVSWWGLWLFALAAGSSWWWTGAGAVAITFMFVFISVPMMESRMLATRQGYGEYRAGTSMLLPLPRRAAKEKYAD